jgi:hypothetical protein
MVPTLRRQHDRQVGVKEQRTPERRWEEGGRLLQYVHQRADWIAASGKTSEIIARDTPPPSLSLSLFSPYSPPVFQRR